MKLIIVIVLFYSFSIFAQTHKNNLRTEETAIESGEIIKIYNNEKLESFTLQILADYYSNSFFFTKENDIITIKNRVESDAIIKLYVKDRKKVSEFLYKDKLIFYTEVIDFDIKKLPAQSKIWNTIYNDEKISYIYKDNLSKAAGDDFEKSYKLFLFLKTSENNATTDLIFNQIADFFSKEDAILRIYLSKYRDKINAESQLNKTGYLTTNELGKIKNGILWTQKTINNGEYHVYKNEQIIKSGTVNLKSFQEIFNTYYTENYNLQE
ncbi:hypothetical protein [Flavobacterium limi]|uniref:Uncharacterized protein n=1 Tax=Flavobacterium limi TaxID=2045105 RepID=A0ABQ1U8W6_9FLAO|nr:hypothetical protein [Flavobacterium limi]GGF11560.1 hypothetical protein GCM10011518_20960 [Flavobacterium limi]